MFVLHHFGGESELHSTSEEMSLVINFTVKTVMLR